MFFKKPLAAIIAASLLAVAGCSDDDDKAQKPASSAASSEGSSSSAPAPAMAFNRIATFPVCQQIEANCNTDEETAAEIVAASVDGNTLIYTDSPQNAVGFIDITDASSPQVAGTLALSGEPTSVAVLGQYAVVGVNTSADYVNTSGELAIIDIATQTLVHSLDLGGQPDSVAVSPDGRYVAIAIENERDEDLDEGIPPQMPAGFLVIVDVAGEPANWATRQVDLTGIADLFPADPEPEYVDINSDNMVVITLQENNHLILVDLATGNVSAEFSAGSVDLTGVDLTEEEPALILANENQDGVVREPDGVTWIGNDYFATANEGDMDGGSRGFSIFNKAGDVVFESGSLDHIAIRLGHYPDARSGNKGNEPENVEYAIFGGKPYLFVNSERSSLVYVYDVTDPMAPQFLRALPAAAGPEGALAIPSRNLLVVASEEDSRGDKMRASVTIYQLAEGDANYPTIISNNAEGTDRPIAWGALSGLAAGGDNTVYAVEDSYYGKSRIFEIDTSTQPAMLTRAMMIKDTNGVMANLTVAMLAEDAPERANVFDQHDLAAMINDDDTVNLDLEGIAMASAGGFWLVSEGAGTIGDDARPINSINMLIKTDSSGVIEDVVTLPEWANQNQVRFGFEGVTESAGIVYVAFQRAWADRAHPHFGAYDTATNSWALYAYPLDMPESQAGGWVGVSDISTLPNGDILVLERDNQAGPDAAIKRLYRINPLERVSTSDIVFTKTLIKDLMPDFQAIGGPIPEKLEGLAVMPNGDVLIVNDNDGVDDNSGETQLMRLQGLVQ